MEDKVYGYELYKNLYSESKVNYSTIHRIKEEYRKRYLKIDDKDLILQLLEDTEKRKFAKNEIALSIIVGLVGYIIGFVIDNIVFEPIKNLESFNFPATIIFAVILCIPAFFAIMFILYFFNKFFLKRYKNIYTIFILPYEIELLEKRLNQLTNGEWNDVSPLPQKENTNADNSIGK